MLRTCVHVPQVVGLNHHCCVIRSLTEAAPRAGDPFRYGLDALVAPVCFLKETDKPQTFIRLKTRGWLRGHGLEHGGGGSLTASLSVRLSECARAHLYTINQEEFTFAVTGAQSESLTRQEFGHTVCEGSQSLLNEHLGGSRVRYAPGLRVTLPQRPSLSLISLMREATWRPPFLFHFSMQACHGKMTCFLSLTVTLDICILDYMIFWTGLSPDA